MSAKRIVAFLEQVFQGFHKKRQQTLAVLVAALVTVGKVGVASLGRAIGSKVAFKHRIKRADRFLANDKIHLSDWSTALLAMVVGERRSIRIAIDSTKVGPWPVLEAPWSVATPLDVARTLLRGAASAGSKATAT